MPEVAENITKLAYVVLPADLMSESLYRIIQEELENNHGYQVRRREDIAVAGHPERLFSELARTHLVVADVTRIDRQADFALGAAMALSARAEDGALHDGPRVILLGDRETVPPEDVAGVPFEHYARDQPATAADAIRRLLARDHGATPGRHLTVPDPQVREVPARLSIADIQGMVPSEVTAEIPDDPVVALLITFYIEHIGLIVGEELAGTAGFPPFPDTPERQLQLIGEFTRRRGSLDSGAVLDLLERSLERYRYAESAHVPPAEGGPESRRIQLLASAVLAERRNQAQIDELSRTLSRIAAQTVLPRTDIRSWPAGIKAISRITRLIASASPPSAVATVQRLLDGGQGLRVIATLGGALFLGGSIGILSADDSGQLGRTYGREGLRLAELTRVSEGQPVKPLTGPGLDEYKAGLHNLSSRTDSIFAIEHPFHFRVLLEVLSDENRRYPAESVLNFQALRALWRPDDLWEHFTWSRDQHPVVGNLVENEIGQRDLAFLQHYVSFGRTPHTSSFVRLDYDPVAYLDEAAENTGSDRTSWWPEAAAHLSSEPIRNLPSSVCTAMYAIDRQQMLGRVWRGQADENDLLWIGGELLKWNGFAFTDGALAGALWDSSRWSDPGFPRMSLAEIRIGTWLLQALRQRLESYGTLAYPQAGSSGAEELAAISAEPERKVAAELRCVLTIMCFFGAAYLSEPGDGVVGLERSLDRLKEDRRLLAELGPLVSQRLDQFQLLVSEEKGKLEAEVSSGRQVLDVLA